MNKIIIYGVPGTGKTLITKLLAKKLHIPLIEADQIKKRVRKNFSKRSHPFFFLGTTQAFKEFGEFNEVNVIKGLLAVRNTLSDSVLNEIKGLEEFVLEGAFLDPNSLLKEGKLLLLTTTDEKIHKQQFLSHREKLFDFSGNEFRAARVIQNYLISEAEKFGVPTIDNSDKDPAVLVDKILGPWTKQ